MPMRRGGTKRAGRGRRAGGTRSKRKNRRAQEKNVRSLGVMGGAYMERENVFSNLSAFALGGLAGAALALLLAPSSGEETRRQMRDKIRRGAERGREKLREGASYTREKLHQGAEYGRTIAERV